MADGVMARFDRELLGAITLLNVLASDTAFDRREYRVLYDRAKEGALDRKGDILLVAGDDHVIFSTGAEFGAELPRATACKAARGPSDKTVTALCQRSVRRKIDPSSRVSRSSCRSCGEGEAVARLHLTIEPANSVRR